MLNIFVGSLAGLYGGVWFLLAFVFKTSPTDLALFQDFVRQVSSSYEESFKLLLLLALFTALGGMSTFALTLLSYVRTQQKKIEVTEDVDRTKDEFISMVLHHVRTPLTGTKWVLAGALKKGQSSLTREDVVLLGEENERAIIAIDHLIGASQVSAKRVQYVYELIEFREAVALVKERADAAGAAAHAKGLGFSVEVPERAAETYVRVDRSKFSLAVEALLDNAVKYTKPGGSVSARLLLDLHELRFEVKDTGIGVPAAEQGKIFRQFYRGMNAKQAHPEGFGIGLYVVKSFIEEQGGRVAFISKEGEGSTFFFTVPVTHTRTETYLSELKAENRPPLDAAA